MNQSFKAKKLAFEDIYKCINPGCDGKGTATGTDEVGEPYPEPCQYCDQHLFPMEKLLSESIEEAEKEGWAKGCGDGRKIMEKAVEESTRIEKKRIKEMIESKLKEGVHSNGCFVGGMTTYLSDCWKYCQLFKERSVLLLLISSLNNQ